MVAIGVAEKAIKAMGVSDLLREAGLVEQRTRRPQSYTRFQLPSGGLSLYVNPRSDDRYVSIKKKTLDCRPRYRNLRDSICGLLSPSPHRPGSDYAVTAEHVPKLIEAVKAMGG